MCLGKEIFLFWSYYLCIFDEIFKRNCFAFDRTTCSFNNPRYSRYYSIIYDALWTNLSVRNLFYFRSYQSPNNPKYTVSPKGCNCIFLLLLYYSRRILDQFIRKKSLHWRSYQTTNRLNCNTSVNLPFLLLFSVILFTTHFGSTYP